MTFLLLTILTGFILTILTVKFRKLCGYLAAATIMAINVLIFMIVYQVFTTSVPFVAGPLFTIPGIGAELVITIDKLSAVFLSLIGIVALLAALYSVDYMDSYPKEGLARFYPFLVLFAASMAMVVSVSDLFFFFIFWEFMTLSSYFLVIFEKDDPTVLRAGFKYLIMTHIGTVCMFIAAFVLQSFGHSFRFEQIGLGLGQLASASPFGLHIVLGLFFVGFATKAGVYPFGTWLPDAHPAAPSGVSAILSGVMIKMGIYGILRVFLYLLPVTPASFLWGNIIAVFGTISIVIGTLNALVQKDSKRLLAFHSIGQIGYVLLAAGIGISFIRDYPAIAAIAVIAGLYHMVNHAFFKSLLFLNAGSVLYRTGLKDLNKLGGLWSLMPVTAVTAAVASLSISGIPPFNGFASKWLIYQVSILGGIKLPLFVICGVAAVFISAVTMASFIKFFSTAFLGDMPGEISGLTSKKKIGLNMKVSQVILSLFCLLLGLLPVLPAAALYGALSNSALAPALPQFSALFNSSAGGLEVLLDGKTVGVWKPLLIFTVFLGLVVLSYVLTKLAGSKKRIVDVWLCGECYDKEQVRYRAHSFYLSFQNVIEKWFFPHISSPSGKSTGKVYQALDFDHKFYYPFVSGIMKFAGKLKKTHNGMPHLYLLWQVMGIIVVMFLFILLAR
jgi:hydrogenase-4 component B